MKQKTWIFQSFAGFWVSVTFQEQLSCIFVTAFLGARFEHLASPSAPNGNFLFLCPLGWAETPKPLPQRQSKFAEDEESPRNSWDRFLRFINIVVFSFSLGKLCSLAKPLEADANAAEVSLGPAVRRRHSIDLRSMGFDSFGEPNLGVFVFVYLGISKGDNQRFQPFLRQKQGIRCISLLVGLEVSTVLLGA